MTDSGQRNFSIQPLTGGHFPFTRGGAAVRSGLSRLSQAPQGVVDQVPPAPVQELCADMAVDAL